MFEMMQDTDICQWHQLHYCQNVNFIKINKCLIHKQIIWIYGVQHAHNLLITLGLIVSKMTSLVLLQVDVHHVPSGMCKSRYFTWPTRIDYWAIIPQFVCISLCKDKLEVVLPHVMFATAGEMIHVFLFYYFSLKYNGNSL